MSARLKIAIVGGVFALLGAIAGAAITGWSQMKLAKQKFNSDLVLKALESRSADERLASLRLLVETKLLKDPEIEEGVRSYAKARESNPSSIPQVAGPAGFGAPIITNPRIYLLAGTESKRPMFESFKSQLEGAGYQVLGVRVKEDVGRPSREEVRYFFRDDQAQAERIAEVVGFKLGKPSVTAAYYEDQERKVNPGYIEIWFGK
jgi:hypothetical protein